MKKLSMVIAAAGAALLSATLVAPAQAITFQSGYCDITLASSYLTNTNGQLVQTVPNSSVSCPGFTFDPSTDELNAWFTTSNGTGYANLAQKTDYTYDAATDTTTTTMITELIASASANPYIQVARTDYGGYNDAYYVKHGGLYYKVRLTQPFTVTEGYTGPTCTLTMPNLSYEWGQENYWVIPNSAMSCTGMSWNPTDFQFQGMFKGTDGTLVQVTNTERKVYDPTTKTMKITAQLEATLPYDPPSGGVLGLRCRCGTSSGSGIGGAGGFGKYSAMPNGYITTKVFDLADSNAYPVELAKPFKVKAATTIVATPTRMEMNGKKMISLHIQADRNQSFQSGDVPSYRRQTVIPKRNADHPTVLRGNKVIDTVTLDKFGEATIMFVDKKGNQKYTVQMPKTATNFLGKTKFTA